MDIFALWLSHLPFSSGFKEPHMRPFRFRILKFVFNSTLSKWPCLSLPRKPLSSSQTCHDWCQSSKVCWTFNLESLVQSDETESLPQCRENFCTGLAFGFFEHRNMDLATQHTHIKRDMERKTLWWKFPSLWCGNSLSWQLMELMHLALRLNGELIFAIPTQWELPIKQQCHLLGPRAAFSQQNFGISSKSLSWQRI